MRRALFGFLIAAGSILVADIAILVGLGTSSEAATGAWWLINFPSVPCLLFCAGPPPMGEAEIGPWDYTAVAISLVGSCISWGLLGACVGWLLGKIPDGSDTPPSAASGAARSEQPAEDGDDSSIGA